MHLQRFLTATLFIAAGAWSTASSAQSVLPSLTSASGASAAGSVVQTEQVRAELLAWAPQGVVPGQPVWVGLQLDHAPDWHTYWKNSGDSGLPTELQWTLPAGIDAGEIAWPTPKKIPIGTLANYGYEKTVLLPVPLTVSPGFSGNQLDVTLKASWLVCRKECIPQEGDFTLRLPVKSSTATSSALFQSTLAATPKPLPAGASRVEVAGNLIKVSLAGLPPKLQGQTLAFFPETGGVIEPGAKWQQAWQGNTWTAEVPLSGQRSESPSLMPVVVALDAAGTDGRASSSEAFRIEAKVDGTWPQGAPVAAVSPALEAALQANAAGVAAPVQNSAAPIGLLAALLGALIGGLILNLMPCVFPVLAIKVVGFVQVKSRAERVSNGVAYSAGVVLSFLALGGVLLALRAAGDQLGWGFQLQSPAVVAALAALFTLIGLNLAGVFEFGGLLPGRVAGLQSKNPTVNAFLSGVLATAIASPCTAPFMGASLGYAVGLPAIEALAVFAAIGFGMALPYLVASLVPAVANALPRPGAWMVTFKTLMAFPMFATVAWLVWVLGQQSGIDGAGALLGLLVLMAFAVWAFTLRGRARVALAALSVAMLALALWNIGPNVTRLQDAPIAAGKPGERWQPWAPGKVEQLTGAGQSVLVDFTAAWCVTCQYNKKTTLADGDVLADVDAKNVALLRADWTRRDPAVTAALAALGRNGVPLYVIYKPGRAPVLLSEILSVDEVRAELARL
ncbi:MAG: protein-disulfide reductase DsbD family protein [Polaromonas sp.]|nr:protein-disulfide reductase DsbD family protein [Polaromonas sp.]